MLQEAAQRQPRLLGPRPLWEGNEAKEAPLDQGALCPVSEELGLGGGQQSPGSTGEGSAWRSARPDGDG